MGAPLMAVVIDASVAVAWFVRSQASNYADRVARRTRHDMLVVPSLWEAEFANVMTTLLRRRVLARHQVASVLAAAGRLGLVMDGNVATASTLHELAEQYGISAYDAAYLELAQRRGLPLATRDAKLARAARLAGMLLS
jgi:predicted nucleic acid-binding protein